MSAGGQEPVGKHKVIALSGGIGGAKLALGLSRVMPPASLMIVANTGDDFEHLGLSISPDIDTLMYTLAGINNPTTGWGRKDETWTFMRALEELGGEIWFKLGDGDLAVHVERTRRLRDGQSLSCVTADLCRRLGIGPSIVPMSDDPVRTSVRADAGWLDFQDYFVRQKCEPQVREIRFLGADTARPQPDFISALSDANLRAVVFCPSNPLISIEPILALPGVRQAIASCAAPVIAVSPIVEGRAVKGPTAKMLDELGIGASAATVAGRYSGLVDAFLVDPQDAETIVGISNMLIEPTQTLMSTMQDRERLAQTVLALADRLDARQRPRRVSSVS
jgi:LPPG:FO 2-phospho-L-lactate transferase